MKKLSVKAVLINLAVTLVFGFLYFYFELPAINLHAVDFYGFFFFLAIVYCVCAAFTSGVFRSQEPGSFWRMLKANCIVPLIMLAALLVIYLVGGLASSVFLRSGSYKQLITVESGDFAEDIDEIRFDQIPMLDRDSAAKLGDRKLGELSDMVSQFEVADDYSQIDYKGRPARVTPLEYGDVFKWLSNRSEGLPAYLVIDMEKQSVEVVRLEEGMKYSTCEHFGRNLDRYLRFNYPTFMFDTASFEIDEEGTPYWVCPKLEKTIGLFGGTDINGAVLVNAVTGETAYYEEVPGWVDRVYSAELLMEQYDYYGTYQNGFWNSIFGQKGVTVTTDGYNYLVQDGDVYMYTGITSVGSDQSNIGFVLSNLRTKATHFYSVAGAEEFSAMSSAEGVVQHLGYDATFPLLLNVQGQPTYFMALKDNAGLVKMYAMVNVQQYQIVANGTTVQDCQKEYLRLIAQNGLELNGEVSDLVETVKGEVTDVRSAVLEGTTWYYLQLKGGSTYYAVSAADSVSAVLVNVGDSVSLSISGEESNGITPATGLILD